MFDATSSRVDIDVQSKRAAAFTAKQHNNNLRSISYFMVHAFFLNQNQNSWEENPLVNDHYNYICQFTTIAIQHDMYAKG